jgi:hypothetical protein
MLILMNEKAGDAAHNTTWTCRMALSDSGESAGAFNRTGGTRAGMLPRASAQQPR